MNRQLVLALCLATGFTGAAEAQWNVARFGERSNWMYASYGLDPAFVATAGYGRSVRFFGHPVQFTADAGAVTAKLDLSDVRARLQARMSLLHWKALRLAGSAAFVTRGTVNSVYEGLTFGSDFTGTAGVYLRHWYLAGEFGFDKDVITHVRNSDWYRTNFYPGAQDGWYLNAGGTFHYGLTAGVSLGPAELMLRAGALRTEKFEPVIPPMFASAGLGVAF